jgi:extradiol dioxygenase
VGHVALAVPDLKAAKAFYTQTMGFRLSDEIDIAVKLAFFHCNPRHHSLALGQVPGMRGILHLMMQVNELDDVGVAYDLVQSRGIPIYRSLGRHTNDRMVSFYVRTPGGFEIEYGWGAVAVDDVGHAATYMTEGSIWGHHPPDPPMRPGAIEPAVESVATA